MTIYLRLERRDVDGIELKVTAPPAYQSRPSGYCVILVIDGQSAKDDTPSERGRNAGLFRRRSSILPGQGNSLSPLRVPWLVDIRDGSKVGVNNLACPLPPYTTAIIQLHTFAVHSLKALLSVVDLRREH
jgi:hypothetical protein